MNTCHSEREKHRTSTVNAKKEASMKGYIFQLQVITGPQKQQRSHACYRRAGRREVEELGF